MKIKLLLLLLISINFVISKTLTLVDSEKAPVVNVEVIILGNQIESLKTDNNGTIEIKDEWIENDKIKILILNDDYEAIEQEVEVIAEETIFSPKAKPKGVRRLQNVVVRTKSKVRNNLTLSTEEMRKYIQSGIFNDVSSIVKNLPGVSSHGNTSSEIFIQGGSNAEWISLYDHMWILNATRFGGNFTAFNPLLIETLEFYTAGYPASIGQGLSGVLWLETLRPSKEDWRFYLAVDKGMEFMAHGPLSKNSRMLFNVRRSWIDLLGDLFFKQEKDPNIKEEDTIHPVITDGMLKLFFDLTENDKLQYVVSASYELAKSKEKFDNESYRRVNGYKKDDKLYSKSLATDVNVLTSLKYIRYFGDNNILTTTLSTTPRTANYQFELPKGDQSFENKLTSLPVQATVDFTSQGIDNHQITTGMNFYRYQVKLEGKIKNSFFNAKREWIVTRKKNNDEYSRFILGSYVMDDWNITEDLVLQTGLRLDYYEQKSDLALQPRGGIVYSLTEELSIFTRGGYYTSNNPSSIDLKNMYDVKDVTMEKATHSISGIEYNYGRWFLLTEGFYKYYWDVRSIDANLSYSNNAIKHSYGGDIYLIAKERPDSIIDGYLSYTLVFADEKVEARKAGVNLFLKPDIPKVGEWYRPDYLRHHTMSAFVRIFPFRPSFSTYAVKNISFSGDLKILSGNPYTGVVGVIRKEGNRKLSIKGKYNEETHPASVNLSLKAEQRITSWFSWHLGVLNVLASNTQVSASYDIDKKWDDSGAERGGKEAIKENVNSTKGKLGFLLGFKVEF